MSIRSLDNREPLFFKKTAKPVSSEKVTREARESIVSAMKNMKADPRSIFGAELTSVTIISDAGFHKGPVAFELSTAKVNTDPPVLGKNA